MKRFGFSTMPKCINCGHWFWYYEMMYLNKDGQHICQKCSERENMETKNLEITVKLNGKEVPLNTISTETFEAIKALEKPKEIPVARLANHSDGSRRLIFKVTAEMVERKGQYVAVDLDNGHVCGHRPGDDGNCGENYGYIRCYKNVIPL